MTGPCDHTRGTRLIGWASAITVCHSCRDYVCSTCGLTIGWHAGLLVANPVVRWRYCGKPACVEAEAAYHGYSVAEMIRHRDALSAKRLRQHLRFQNSPARPLEVTRLPSGAEQVKFTPPVFALDPGEACWCNRGKDCDGGHEVGPITVVNRCGICGKTFQITADDPHWSTGRGPICPDDGRLS